MSEPTDNEAIDSYVQHRRAEGDGLVVLEAHVAADCPDREHCWARNIHDLLSPRPS